MDVNAKTPSVGQIDILKQYADKTFISKNKIGKGLSVDSDGDLVVISSGGSEDVERILISGFTNGTKQTSDDGTTIISKDDLGRTLTKTFSSDFLKCTTVLENSAGKIIATLEKVFSSDGKEIESTVTYEEST